MLADDHVLVAQAFVKILEPEFEVMGTFSDGQSLLAALPSLKPDLVVLDVGMPLMNGFEAGRRIKKLMHSVKILYLTMNCDIGMAAEAFRCGASGYLLKTAGASELAIAVREILAGQQYISQLLTRDPERFFLESRVLETDKEELTSRQREVLQLLTEGRSMKEVAYILKLTPRTVAFHKYRIMDRLHMRTNAELVQYAMKEHIISSRI